MSEEEKIDESEAPLGNSSLAEKEQEEDQKDQEEEQQENEPIGADNANLETDPLLDAVNALRVASQSNKKLPKETLQVQPDITFQRVS